MAASLRSRTPQVTAQTLAQQAVPRARKPDGEQFSRSEWRGERNVSEDFAPSSPALDVQALPDFAQRHGMRSSIRLFGQPLTRRVSRSVE